MVVKSLEQNCDKRGNNVWLYGTTSDSRRIAEKHEEGGNLLQTIFRVAFELSVDNSKLERVKEETEHQTEKEKACKQGILSLGSKLETGIKGV